MARSAFTDDFFPTLSIPGCITGLVEPLRSFNKGACGTKLLPMIVLAYPVDCVCFCHLLNTQHCCLCPNGRYNPPPSSHPLHPPLAHPSPYTRHPLIHATPYTCHPLIHATRDITAVVKKLLKIQQ